MGHADVLSHSGLTDVDDMRANRTRRIVTVSHLLPPRRDVRDHTAESLSAASHATMFPIGDDQQTGEPFASAFERRVLTLNHMTEGS
jgi:hypothetical protein